MRAGIDWLLRVSFGLFALACESTQVEVAHADARDPPSSASACEPRVSITEGTDWCTRALAARYFTTALCICGDADVVDLTSDGFDSSLGPLIPGSDGGAVAIQGNCTAAGRASIGDALSIGGPGLQSFLISLSTRTDLRIAGRLAVTGRLEVGRDAFIAGGLTATTGTVHRDLYLPETAALTGIITVEGLTQRTGVTVTSPCPCGDDDRLDVPALVQRARASNDNAQIGLSPSAFGANTDSALTLPCGTYFVDSVVSDALELDVTGPAALFVAGDFVASPGLRITLQPGAELDVFVQGQLDLSANAALSDPTHPGSVRVYAPSSTSLRLGTDLVGAVYVPQAQVEVSVAPRSIYGALLARSIEAVSLDVHHDRALLRECSPASAR